MTLHATLENSAWASAVVFFGFWPVFTWWLRRWYTKQSGAAPYRVAILPDGRRLAVLGALWALLPASYTFAYVAASLLAR